MRRLLILIVLMTCLAMSALAVGAENAELYGNNSAQINHALKKAHELSDCIQREEDSLIVAHIPEEMKVLITENDYSEPVHIICMTPSKDFDLHAILSVNGLSESYGCTLCFDVFREVNGYGSDNRAFTEWSERAAIYDTMVVTSDYPTLSYVVCIYGENLPQIVTAMYKTNEKTAITKTSFVYSDKVIDETYAAFPFIAHSVWKELDTQIIY